MMRQYLEMKKQVPDALLLFRMGDFYELFFDDAEKSARVLGLTLTSREKGPDAIPMAGFPYHALDGYLRKLLQAGIRVAICEQVEDPKEAKGLVKRDITRIVTPGTITDEALLDPRQHNFLVCIAPPSKRMREFGLSWVDLSRGALHVAAIEPAAMVEELARLEPTECLVPEELEISPDWFPLAMPAMTRRPAWTFSKTNAHDLVYRHFRVSTFEGFGVPADSPGLLAAGALLAYLHETQKTDLKHIASVTPYHRGEVMILDPVTRRSLELTRTMRENRRDGTLLAVMDETVTASGSRCLADWISAPLLDVEKIRYRQAAIEEWKDNPVSRQEIRELLRKTYDVERLASRVSTGRTHPRDLASLRDTLRCLPALKAKLGGRNARMNADLEASLELLPELRRELEAVLVDDPPMQVREGGIVRDGYHPELDELRDIAKGGKQWMAQFQQAEIQRTGIANLKVGFNKVFGFYLEVPNSGRDKVPATYHRKQTLKNAERYITPELKVHEEKVLGAEERSKSLEYEIFLQLRDKVSAYTPQLQAVAQTLAQLDCVLGLAEVAQKRNYVRPKVEASEELCIEAGRHPVLDSMLSAGRFVPNDTQLGPEHGRFMLITGPNMAGKSTYIRQVALITLLAQTGSFVPAAAATIGIVDRIFTRVGASDELGKGQSTFMVEMTETANILNNATSKSLVILDEIGRGTSTYDGVSLAWAIAEHLHDKNRCRTLFATHYHELIELTSTLEGMRNKNVAVREWKDEIIFLHQIVDGGADRSYGIHVARLAGIPKEVLRRAQTILDKLERDPFGEHAPVAGQPRKHRRTYHQLSLFPTTTAHPILDQLRILELDRLTAEQAVAMLRDWQQQLLADGDEH